MYEIILSYKLPCPRVQGPTPMFSPNISHPDDNRNTQVPEAVLSGPEQPGTNGGSDLTTGPAHPASDWLIPSHVTISRSLIGPQCRHDHL